MSPVPMFGIAPGVQQYAQDQAALAEMAARRDLLAAQAADERSASELRRTQGLALLAESRRKDDEAARLARTNEAVARSLSGLASPQGGLPEQGATPPVRPPHPADVLERTGFGVFAEDPERGEKMIKLASHIRTQEAAAGENRAQQREAETRTALQQINYVEELFSGVRSPEDHRRALMLLQSNPIMQGAEIPPPLRQYDPQVIRAFLAGSKVLREQLESQRRAEVSAAQVSNLENEILNRNTRTLLDERRVSLAEERAESASKVSPEPSMRPLTNAERLQVSRIFKEEGLDFEADTLASTIDFIAEDAKIEVTRNPSVSYAKAIRRAINEARARGDITQGSRVLGIGSSDKFRPSEGSMALPLALPPNPAQLVSGRYYTAPDGRLGKYLGNGQFEPVSRAVARPRPGAQ